MTGIPEFYLQNAKNQERFPERQIQCLTKLMSDAAWLSGKPMVNKPEKRDLISEGAGTLGGLVDEP